MPRPAGHFEAGSFVTVILRFKNVCCRTGQEHPIYLVRGITPRM
jgi:hypothetical protein